MPSHKGVFINFGNNIRAIALGPSDQAMAGPVLK